MIPRWLDASPMGMPQSTAVRASTVAVAAAGTGDREGHGTRTCSWREPKSVPELEEVEAGGGIALSLLLVGCGSGCSDSGGTHT